MTVTFINHSCFVVELEKNILIFDYYRGKLPEFEKQKHIYMLSSHKHSDHFDLKIFELAKQYENITYILSNDIKLNEKYLERKGIKPELKEKMVLIGKHQEKHIGDLHVETLKSTDEGVAFMVQCEGKTLYHAGDLNWWHWEGEPGSWNENQEKNYKREVDSLRKRKIDAAFIVLDPRLKQAADLGMAYFMEQISVDTVFPMHCFNEFGIIKKFKKKYSLESWVTRVVDIHGDRETFEF